MWEHHKNVHGNVVALVDESGNRIVNYQYDAWGNLTNTPEVVTTGNGEYLRNASPFRYSSYQFDSESGLYYLKARYYSAAIGRFLTRDKTYQIGEFSKRGQTLYSYCWNSPTIYIDPTGNKPPASEVPPKSSGYKPPKGGPRKGIAKNGKKGWVDKDGNVWVPDPTDHGGEHWDVNIFEYLGRVPTKIWFDNLSATVASIAKDRERKLVEQFERFALHYGFASNFCNPNSGHEKGSVENKIKGRYQDRKSN